MSSFDPIFESVVKYSDTAADIDKFIDKKYERGEEFMNEILLNKIFSEFFEEISRIIQNFIIKKDLTKQLETEKLTEIETDFKTQLSKFGFIILVFYLCLQKHKFFKDDKTNLELEKIKLKNKIRYFFANKTKTPYTDLFSETSETSKTPEIKANEPNEFFINLFMEILLEIKKKYETNKELQEISDQCEKPEKGTRFNKLTFLAFLLSLLEQTNAAVIVESLSTPKNTFGKFDDSTITCGLYNSDGFCLLLSVAMTNSPEVLIEKFKEHYQKVLLRNLKLDINNDAIFGIPMQKEEKALPNDLSTNFKLLLEKIHKMNPDFVIPSDEILNQNIAVVKDGLDFTRFQMLEMDKQGSLLKKTLLHNALLYFTGIENMIESGMLSFNDSSIKGDTITINKINATSTTNSSETKSGVQTQIKTIPINRINVGLTKQEFRENQYEKIAAKIFTKDAQSDEGTFVREEIHKKCAEDSVEKSNFLGFLVGIPGHVISGFCRYIDGYILCSLGESNQAYNLLAFARDRSIFYDIKNLSKSSAIIGPSGFFTKSEYLKLIKGSFKMSSNLLKEKFEYVGNSTAVTRIEFIGRNPDLPAQNFLTVLDEKYIIALCNYTTQWRNYVKEFKDFFIKRNIEHEIFQGALNRLIDEMNANWFVGDQNQIKIKPFARITEAVFDRHVDTVFSNRQQKKYHKDSLELGINQTPVTEDFTEDYFKPPNEEELIELIETHLLDEARIYFKLNPEILLPEILLEPPTFLPNIDNYLKSLLEPTRTEGLATGLYELTTEQYNKPEQILFINPVTEGLLAQGTGLLGPGPGKGGRKSTKQSKRRKRKATRKQKRINNKRKGVTKKIIKRKRRTTRKRY